MTQSAKKYLRIFLYVFLPAGILAAGIISRDAWYMTAISSFSVVYLLSLNEGKRYAYLLCVIYALTYGAASFYMKLYAGAAFSVFVLAPSGLYRLIAGDKAEKDGVRSLDGKGWAIVLGGIAALTAGLYFLLRALHGSQPLSDGISLALGVATSLLMTLNYSEMWYTNIFTSLIFLFIWVVEYSRSGTGLSMVVLQSISFLISVRGVVMWKKRARVQREEAAPRAE